MDVNWDEREISVAEGVSPARRVDVCVFTSSSSALHLIKHEKTASDIFVKSSVPPCWPRELYNLADVDELPR